MDKIFFKKSFFVHAYDAHMLVDWHQSHHDFTIDWVIDVISHGCPSLNTFYVIKHHPHILQIITWLHWLN
jgi:hypothetical protein